MTEKHSGRTAKSSTDTKTGTESKTSNRGRTATADCKTTARGHAVKDSSGNR